LPDGRRPGDQRIAKLRQGRFFRRVDRVVHTSDHAAFLVDPGLQDVLPIEARYPGRTPGVELSWLRRRKSYCGRLANLEIVRREGGPSGLLVPAPLGELALFLRLN